jgi:hypothetical protein
MPLGSAPRSEAPGLGRPANGQSARLTECTGKTVMVPTFEDSDDGIYALGRMPGRFQVSRRFKKGDPAEPDRRYAYEVFDSEDDVVFSSEDGWETVLRDTPTRQQLKAIFFETGRHVSSLAFQRFNSSGKPIQSRQTLLLTGNEVKVLRDFLTRIELADLVGEEGVKISADAARELLAGHELPHELLRERQEDIVEFLRSDITAPDVLALARRKAALNTFEEMLHQNLAEPVWQQFFETEPWILGVAGAPQFLDRVGDSLESVVQGWDDVGTVGKRADALLRTAGALSAFTFVEIKRPDTPLLRSTPYRSGAWAVSDDLAGGVAQVHATVDAAHSRLAPRHAVATDDGFDTGRTIEFCRPRALLVVGSLEQMIRDGAVHHERHRCFEAFRRSIREPEIVTFDEILHRARAVLSTKEA